MKNKTNTLDRYFKPQTKTEQPPEKQPLKKEPLKKEPLKKLEPAKTKTIIQPSSPHSTVLGLPPSSEVEIQQQNKPTPSDSLSSLSSLPTTDPPSPIPSPSPPPSPSKEIPQTTSKSTLPALVSEYLDLDDLEQEDEWINRMLAQKTPAKKTATTHLTPPVQPTRRSERNLNKPSSSSTIMKIRPMANTSKPQEKFSLDSILKDRHLRQKRQANLSKRKREEFDHFDPNQLPDQFIPPSTQVTPKKKGPLQHQTDQEKKKTKNTKIKQTKFNSICQEEEAQNNDNEYEDRDLLNSPSKLKLLKENIDLLQRPTKNQADNHASNSSGGGVHKLIQQDIQTGQLAGLNRGSAFRQVYQDIVFLPSPSPKPSTSDLSFSKHYPEFTGVAQNPSIVDFVQEIIDNLNVSIEDPDFLPINLVDWLPKELSEEPTREVSNSHSAILKILFKPIIDGGFPTTVVGKVVFLIDSYVKNMGHYSGEPRSATWGEFWLRTLQNGMIKLGILNRLVYFGQYCTQDDEDVAQIDDQEDIGLDFDARIERVRAILNLFNVLSTRDLLDERGRRWAFTISIRIALEPNAEFKLRTEVVTYLSQVLNRILTKTNQDNEKDTRMMKKDDMVLLVSDLLQVGLDMKTWTNVLELVRIIPLSFHFRKCLAMGFLDLFPFLIPIPHLNHPENAEKILPKMARWLTNISNKFANPPPAREIYNSIKPISKRPYEESTSVEPAINDLMEEGPPPLSTSEEGKKAKLRGGFEWYLGESTTMEPEVEGVSKKTSNMNEIQCKDMVELFQMLFVGIWDYLVLHRDQVKTSGYRNNNHPSRDSSTNNSISGSNVSPHLKAERIKLKNSIYRLSSGLDFLNQESFLVIKGADSKGQIKLDKFFSSSNNNNCCSSSKK